GGDTTLPALFARRVAAEPRATLLIDGVRSLDGMALERRANAFAHDLLARGLTAQEPVALRFDRPIEAWIAQLAVLKAGGACLPLPATIEPARLAKLMADFGVRFLVSDGPITERASTWREIGLAALAQAA